jgi:hypothetical protein
VSINFFTDVSFRVPFDWAFVQCGPEQLSEAQYRSFLTSVILDDPMPIFEAKVALNLIAHRLDSQQGCSSIDSGVLLLIADIMRTGRNGLPADDFGILKEHLFDLPQINALFTSSMISAEMIEQGIRVDIAMRLHVLMLWFAGIQPILDAAVDPTNIVDRNLLLPFSSHWAQVFSSASRFTAVSQV